MANLPRAKGVVVPSGERMMTIGLAVGTGITMAIGRVAGIGRTMKRAGVDEETSEQGMAKAPAHYA
jgi:hypothetical protein